MGKTLQNITRDFLAQNGAEAYELLAKRIGKSPKTVRRWINERIPNSHAAYQLAKALGCGKAEALSMANEPSFGTE